uniref:Gastric inhibitory polypeptide receptor n=1 Tax=Strigops habroptila TaxID=2489341 RepID=A0A672V6I2_STRHB
MLISPWWCPHVALPMAVSPQERSARATLAAWLRYRQACELRLRLDPPAPGPVCNRSFDMYACWGDAPPNSTASVPCPPYLPWHHRVQGGLVFRRCGPDGRWVTDGTGRPWQDHGQCEDTAPEQPLQLRLLYTIGYSLSLVALVLALLLLLLFRRLRCTRNFIHANLFVSFVLRAGAILTRDALLQRRLRAGAGHPLHGLRHEAVAGCRLAQAITQYCVGANYGWLLAEGLFLHKLLVLAAFSGERCLPAFLLLGWGAPVLFVVPWVVVRYLYENEGCWERNEKPAVWWIIRCPILVAVAVNFVVFIRIVRILVAKVRAHQVSRGDTRVRLARSTLTLIPLLGVHEVAFALAGDGPGGGAPAAGAALPASAAVVLTGRAGGSGVGRGVGWGVWDMGIWGVGYGDMGCGGWGMGYGICGMGYGVLVMGYGVWGMGMGCGVWGVGWGVWCGGCGVGLWGVGYGV